MALTLVTAISTEPITSTEAKLHAKVDVAADDALFTTLITAVRERGELATGRAFAAQTWDLVLDAFPNCGYIEIPKPPLTSITHVKYVDTAGTLQTWAATNYDVQAPSGPRCARGRVALSYGKSWPSTYGEIGDVTIRFVCGYSTIPSLLKAAMLMDLVTLYRHREAVVTGTIVTPVPSGVRDMYWSYRSVPIQQIAA